MYRYHLSSCKLNRFCSVSRLWIKGSQKIDKIAHNIKTQNLVVVVTFSIAIMPHSQVDFKVASLFTDGSTDLKGSDVPMQNQHLLTEIYIANTGETETPRKIKGSLWGFLVAGLVFANLLTSLNNTILADIQVPIIVGLGDFNKFPWISVGFGLEAASAQFF